MAPEPAATVKQHGRAGDIFITRGARRAVIGLLILVLVMGAAALLSSYYEWHDYEAAQQRQGLLLEEKLCTTLDQLAALKPPAGNASSNPSRAYEQRLGEVLAQLRPDLGCR
jgi:hypothetical protein